MAVAGTDNRRLSLRAKGLLGFAAVVLYLGGVSVVIRHERLQLLHMASEIERSYAQGNALAKTSYALAHSIYKLQEKFFSTALGTTTEDEIALDVELVQAGLKGLLQYDPNFGAEIERLSRQIAIARPGQSRSSLIELLEVERALERRLDRQIQSLRDNQTDIWHQYREKTDTISVIASISGLVGAIFFGGLLIVFLNRLTWDIAKVAERAASVASGARNAPLEITRNDEIGDLMRAVNDMQSKLRMWEQQMEIARQQQFHREKMAAIGSLAAGVAHEINNPIAAIAGLAQSLKSDGHAAAGGSGTDPIGLILQQTKRISAISRQIAELTAPHSPEPELLDINSLVRSTCSFITYDKRFRDIDLKLELDNRLPAVTAVADHLTQVLMNLLINAADAMEKIEGRKPAIRVATHAGADNVVIEVADNGLGMEAAVLARAFEESYTTKPPEKGRGLGLFLCKSLIEAAGNHIELESAVGTGTTARIRLSLNAETGAR